MQLVGQSMRTIWADCWVHAWENEVVATWAEYGAVPIIVPDVRYRNEVAKIKEMGGIVIRLTRHPFEDMHPSEIELDGCMDSFDLILDNAMQDEAETCGEALAFCRERGIV
jgi:hypothetical protein